MKIIFKFHGGPFDGKRVAGSEQEPGEALDYYALSYHGRVGQRFRTASDLAVHILARDHLQDPGPHHFQSHIYEVVDRIENDGVLLVRTQYIPQAHPRQRSPV
jgi:hypothetical protein